MEELFEVKPVGVKYKCATCGVGKMLPTGVHNWVCDPPQIEHKCDHCGEKIVLNEKYPLIRYQSTIK